MLKVFWAGALPFPTTVTVISAAESEGSPVCLGMGEKQIRRFHQLFIVKSASTVLLAVLSVSRSPATQYDLHNHSSGCVNLCGFQKKELASSADGS
jgi:hypothetical protein